MEKKNLKVCRNLFDKIQQNFCETDNSYEIYEKFGLCLFPTIKNNCLFPIRKHKQNTRNSNSNFIFCIKKIEKLNFPIRELEHKINEVLKCATKNTMNENSSKSNKMQEKQKNNEISKSSRSKTPSLSINNDFSYKTIDNTESKIIHEYSKCIFYYGKRIKVSVRTKRKSMDLEVNRTIESMKPKKKLMKRSKTSSSFYLLNPQGIFLIKL